MHFSRHIHAIPYLYPDQSYYQYQKAKHLITNDLYGSIASAKWCHTPNFIPNPYPIKRKSNIIIPQDYTAALLRKELDIAAEGTSLRCSSQDSGDGGGRWDVEDSTL